MDETKKKFLKVKSSQVLNKFIQLQTDKQPLKIWKKASDAFDLPVHSIKLNEEQEIIVYINSQSLPYDFSKKEDCFLNFSLNELMYFSVMHFLDKDEDESLTSFRLSDEVYRFERRDNERLMTYPTYSTYAYFSHKSEIKEFENVIPFIRDEQIKVFSEVKNKFSPEMIEDGSEVKGFRLIDLSKVGLSLLVNESEAKFFTHCRTNKIVINMVLISHEEKLFKLKNLDVKYLVDYINPSAKSIRFQKVGMTFDRDMDLSKYLSEFFDDEFTFENLKKEFENEV